MATVYCKIVYLLIDICPTVLRRYFDYLFKKDEADTSIDIDTYMQKKKNDLKGKGKLKPFEFCKVFQATKVSNENWDVSTLTCLIRCLFPHADDAVERIRTLRNKVFHTPKIESLCHEEIIDQLQDAIKDILQTLSDKDFRTEVTTKIASVLESPDTPDEIIKRIVDTFFTQEQLLVQVLETNQILKDIMKTDTDISGKTIKRIKTDDHVQQKLKDNLEFTILKELDEGFQPVEKHLKLVKRCLQDNKFVIVTGDDKGYCLKICLALIKDVYDREKSLEISSTVCWNGIKKDEVQVVLWKNPFGSYSLKKDQTDSVWHTIHDMYEKANCTQQKIGLHVIIVTAKSMLDAAAKELGEDFEPFHHVVPLFRSTSEDFPINISGREHDGSMEKALANMIHQSACLLGSTYGFEINDSFVQEAKSRLDTEKNLALIGYKDQTIMSVVKEVAMQPAFHNKTLVITHTSDIKDIDMDVVKLVVVRYSQVAKNDSAMFDTLHAMKKKLHVIVTCKADTFQEFNAMHKGGHILFNNSMIVQLKDTKKATIKTEPNINYDHYNFGEASSNDDWANESFDKPNINLFTRSAEIELQFPNKIRLSGTEGSYISGMCFVNGMLVAADAFGSCLHAVITKSKRSLSYKFSTIGDPWDVTEVKIDDQSHVAVTFPNKGEIRFYTIQVRPRAASGASICEQKGYEIRTDNKCRGIAKFGDGKIIVCCSKEGQPGSVIVYDTTSKTEVSSFSNPDFHDIRYIAVSRNESIIHIVDAAGSEGRILSTTANGVVLSNVEIPYPNGVTIYPISQDRECVVVCSRTSNSSSREAKMVQVDIESESATEIQLPLNSEFVDPNCIAFSSGRFFVGMNDSKHILVFEIENHR